MDESDSTVPYGYCHCGCGKKTTIAKVTVRGTGRIKGQPMRFVSGHNGRLAPPKTSEEYRAEWLLRCPEIPYGFCQCGCGVKTPLLHQDDTKRGYVRGEPALYLTGHAAIAKLNERKRKYRREWELARPDIPYGYCWCGCGDKTRIADYTVKISGWVQGEPLRYIQNHWGKSGIRTAALDYRDRWIQEAPDIPYGLCWCGCGQPTVIQKKTTRHKGLVKGEPARFILGHTYKSAKLPWKLRSAQSENIQAMPTISKGLVLRRAKQGKRRRLKASAHGSHTAEDIEQMYQDQDGRCAYCETQLHGDYHVDHMIPLCRGGSDDALNLAITCPNCNIRKKAKTTEEFFAA